MLRAKCRATCDTHQPPAFSIRPFHSNRHCHKLILLNVATTGQNSWYKNLKMKYYVNALCSMRWIRSDCKISHQKRTYLEGDRSCSKTDNYETTTQWETMLVNVISHIRYVDLMCSLFLIKHLYLSCMWHGLYLRMDTKETCITMRFEYVLRI